MASKQYTNAFKKAIWSYANAYVMILIVIRRF